MRFGTWGGVGLLRRPSCISDAETMEVQDLSFREAVSVHEGVAGARVHEAATDQALSWVWFRMGAEAHPTGVGDQKEVHQECSAAGVVLEADEGEAA